MAIKFVTCLGQSGEQSDAHQVKFFAALGEVLAGPPTGFVSGVSSTQTLDEAFAAAGITG